MKVGLACHVIGALLTAPGAYAGGGAARIVEQQRIVAAVKAARAQLAQDTQQGRAQLAWDARGRVHGVQ